MNDEPTTRSTGPEPVGTLASVSVDCPDPSSLADFYGRLLGMRRAYEHPDGIVALGASAADHQAAPDILRVLTDPAGHPFCLATVTVD